MKNVFLMSLMVALIAFTACGKNQNNHTEIVKIEVAHEYVDFLPFENSGVPSQGISVKEAGGNEWSALPAGFIEGFSYQPGSEYHLTVVKTHLAQRPADGFDFSYRLKSVDKVAEVIGGVLPARHDAKPENFGTLTEPIVYKNGEVVVLAVDYTTNVFLGGYTVPTGITDAMVNGEFALRADYHEPGDFGDVTIYDNASNTKLFAGGIVWMGTGNRTYPKEMYAPEAFNYYAIVCEILPAPKPTMFYYDGFDAEYGKPYDLAPVMAAINRVGIAWQAIANGNRQGAPVYTMLYRRSVGAGDPTDWYWLVFIRG